jgi:UDP-glucose 4-epimerase
MKLKGKNIMVTGGAGFIGSHLVDALIEMGTNVSIVDNLSTGRKENVNPKATFYEIDINDKKLDAIFAKEKPEIVYSLAFNTIVPKSVADPLFDAKSLTGNLHVMVLARKYGVKKFIMASSGFVYGNTKNLPTAETEPIIPTNPYIITKSASEHYLQFFKSAHNMDFVVLRYATVYGPRQVGGAMADYIRSIRNNVQATIWGNGEKTRDYVFVKDVIDANIKALDVKVGNSIMPVFNIGTMKETSLNELYSKIAILLGKPDAKPKYEPDRPGEMMRFCLSYKKAEQYLGWKPRFNLDEGLPITVGQRPLKKLVRK